MGRVAMLQASFNSGELSPLAFGETGFPAYKKGLETCLNYIPTLQGPLVRRPGTRFVNAVKDSTKAPVLIPFQFSITQAYMLEFGDKYIRFYANGGRVVVSANPLYSFGNGVYQDPLSSTVGFFTALRASSAFGPGEGGSFATSVTVGTALELVSPYAVADVAKIKYVQTADTLYLFHPSYPTYKLQRSGQNYWSLKSTNFADGPYLPMNSYATFGDSTNITLTTLANYNLSPKVTTVGVSIAGAITDPAGSGQIQITTAAAHKLNTGQKVFIAGVGGTTEANNNDSAFSHPFAPYYWTVTVTSTTVFLLQGSVFTHAYTAGGTSQPALFWANMGSPFPDPRPDYLRVLAFTISTFRYYGTITFFTDAASANLWAGDISQSPILAPSSTVASSWFLGTYSYGNGFPSCGTFHQDRLVLAGCPNAPQQVDGSSVGDYESFAPSDRTTLNVNDSNAFSFVLNSRDVNAIRWVTSSAQGLLAGSYTAEWSIASSSANEALTSTNVNASQTSVFGSADVDAIQIGNAALYVGRAQRKLRELNYFFQVGTFRSTDLTALSEHITIPTITKLAVQKETQPLVWAVRADGALISMIYDRNDVSIQAGWTRHLLGGKSDLAGTPPIVTSIGVIPSKDLSFDQLWMVVKRYINGAFVYNIEYMTRIFDDSTAQADACQLDCSGTYDSSITITGISTATTAVVTAPSHGFIAGNQVRIEGVVGLTQTTTDLNGNLSTSSLVNSQVFVVGPGVTTNTFALYDSGGNPVSSVAYGPYISGGTVAKLVTTISGLTWLANETVSVLADGSIHPDVVVSGSGGITLQFPAAKVQIGYSYNSDGKLLRTEGGAPDGTSIGKTRRTTRAALMLHKTGDISVGTSFDNLIPVSFEIADSQAADTATPLYSGITRVGLESKYDFESQVCFRQNSPLPGMVQSITVFMEEFDV